MLSFLYSLRFQLLVSFLILTLGGVSLFAFWVKRSALAAFNSYLDESRIDMIAAFMLNHYQETGSWQGVEASLPPPPPPLRSNRDRPPPPEGLANRGPPRTLADIPQAARGGRIGLLDADNRVLFSLRGQTIGEVIDPETLEVKRDLYLNGEFIGTAMRARAETGRAISPESQAFLLAVNRTIRWAGLTALLLALLIAIPVIEYLLRSLRRLSKASEVLTQGELGHQVKEGGSRELRQLSISFNQMSTRLAELSSQRKQMTADIAHDLGTPLAVVSGYVQSLRKGQIEPSRERFEVLEEELEHMQRLTADLRMLSKVESGQLELKPAEYTAETLLRSVQRSFSVAASSAGVLLDVKIEKALPSIKLDLELMKRVFSNLVSNALRSTPEGGKVFLRAEEVEDGLLLEVTDTGHGVAEDDVPYLFERHFRADKSRSDTRSGLGLAIAKSIIDLHNGRISAKSALGQGMTIRMWLPN